MKSKVVLSAVADLLVGMMAGAIMLGVLFHGVGALRARTMPQKQQAPILLFSPRQQVAPTPTPEPLTEEETWRNQLDNGILPQDAKNRERFFEMGPDAKDEFELICPDCYRHEMVFLSLTGDLNDPFLSMIFQYDRRSTARDRAFYGIEERML